MKIPTSPPGGAPYYPGPPHNGMEMNPQWQGNGAILDGAAAGNGAPYIHMQHLQQPGFVPNPGYYGPNSPPVAAQGPASASDFSEYLWMENMEAFDEEVMHQLEEEALMEQCVEAMLEDEREARRNLNAQNVPEHQVFESTLNPLAAEFVPKFALAAAPIPPPTEPAVETPSEQPSTSDAVKSLETSVAQISISNDNSTDATDGAKPSSIDSEDKKSLKDEDIVVVSAKDTVKTAREQKVEKKQNKDVKKKDEPVKVQKENSKPAAKPVEVVETKPIVKEEAPPVDLQGPPLPTPAAPLATVVEPEPKPAAPAVFNYAAAAKANLPPKQPASATQPTPAATPKPEIVKESPPEAKTANAPRPRQAQKPGGHKQAAPIKKGKK